MSKDKTLFWLTSLDDFSDEYWNDTCTLDHKSWYLALNDSKDPNFDFGFLVFFEKNRPVSHCMIQFIKIQTSFLSSVLPKWLIFLLGFIPYFTLSLHGKRYIQAMVAGDIFITSEKSFTPVSMFIQGIDWLQEILPKHSYLYVFKDVHRYSKSIPELEKQGFSVCFSEPEMSLDIDDNWQHIDDYVNALNTKYKRRYRSARKKGLVLRSKIIPMTALHQYKMKLQLLLDLVLERRKYSIFEEKVDLYIRFSKILGNKFSFRLYEIENEVVGFSTSIIHNDTLIAHRVGMDYSINKTHKLYQNMLYDYIDSAIELKCKRLSFGRTALEIKSAVGALPNDVMVLMKFSHPIPNYFLQFVLYFLPKPKWIWRNALQTQSNRDLNLDIE